jgi:cytochrome P450
MSNWVLRDAERFSSQPVRDDVPHTDSKILLAMDGEEHRRYRALVKDAFAPAAFRVLERDRRPVIHEPARRDPGNEVVPS